MEPTQHSVVFRTFISQEYLLGQVGQQFDYIKDWHKVIVQYSLLSNDEIIVEAFEMMIESSNSLWYWSTGIEENFDIVLYFWIKDPNIAMLFKLRFC